MCFSFARCSGTPDWMIRIQRAVQGRKTEKNWELWKRLPASEFCGQALTLFPPFVPPPFVPFNSYCVYLRVKQASAACKLKLWSAHLVRERLVCAECQSDAMSKKDRCGGEGLESTRWAVKPKHTKTWTFCWSNIFITNFLIICTMNKNELTIQPKLSWFKMHKSHSDASI